MAKKIRFPLEMKDGVKVRSVEELREHFSTVNVLTYVHNGKLVTWLRDRYADDLADAVEQLDDEDTELPRKVSEIFDVPYHEEDAENLQADMERSQRLEMLRAYTNEERFITHIDDTAFDQDDLYDLLDEGKTEIYLCGDRFSIPLAKKGITYIGVNNPIAVIDSKGAVDWKKKEISLECVRYDEKYQILVEAEEERKRKKYQVIIQENSLADITAVLVDDNKNVIAKIVDKAICIKEWKSKVYSIVSENRETGQLHVYDIKSMEEKVFGNIVVSENVSYEFWFEKMLAGDNSVGIINITDRWLVYKGYCDKFSICDLINQIAKVSEKQYLAPYDRSIVIVNDFLYFTVQGRICKLNLETLEVTDIFNRFESYQYGDLMTNGDQLLCFYGKQYDISFYKIDYNTDVVMQSHKISDVRQIHKSIYEKEKVYFVGRVSNSCIKINCLDLVTEKVECLMTLDSFSFLHADKWDMKIVENCLYCICEHDKLEKIIKLD